MLKQRDANDRLGKGGDASSAMAGPGGMPGKRTQVDAARGGGGTALPADVLARMQRSFGADFSGVRIHQDDRAQAMGALAYTDGADIHMAPGQYDPSSEKGQTLIGHELAHVVQQRAGRVTGEPGPPGAGMAINRDASLEAEADQAGARAARGEPAGIGGSGSGTAPARPIIQRYADVQLDAAAWKLSDGNRMLTRTDGSHDLYAHPATIQAGEAALAAAGSFVRIAGQNQAPGGHEAAASVLQHGLHKVTAAYRARGAAANHAHTPAAHKGNIILGSGGQREPGLAEVNQNGAGPLVTPAQCIDTARLVMGVTNGAGARDREMPAASVDGHNKIHKPQAEQDFLAGSFQNMKHLPSSTEAGALTALNRQLLDFLDSRELRQLDDQPARKVEVMKFRRAMQQLHPDDPSRAWVVFHDLKVETPAVYTAFTQHAKLDAAATPEVGEALTTYVAETKAGQVFRTNRALYDALVEQLTLPVVTQMGITADTSSPKIKEIVDAAAKVTDVNHAHAGTLADVFGDHATWNMHWAGVVLADGTDHVSLENDASTKIPSREGGQDAAATTTGGDINASWRFQMYGSARPGQSFHDHMLAGGDFGDFAATTKFRRPQAAEVAIGKPESRVYALRMAAGTALGLVDDMRWELFGHDAAAAGTASPAQFAATLTVESIEGKTDVRMMKLTVLDRAMPPGVQGAIEQGLEMIDVWRLRSPGAAVVDVHALRDRLRVFHYAVKYLLSLGDQARPVDRYVSSVSRGARKLEVDAEIRPGFAELRSFAASVADRRTPATEDGMTIGLMFQLLGFLDSNVLVSYERGETYPDTARLLALYRRAVVERRQDVEKLRTAILQRHLDLQHADYAHVRNAGPILDRCDTLFARIEAVCQRLHP